VLDPLYIDPAALLAVDSGEDEPRLPPLAGACRGTHASVQEHNNDELVPIGEIVLRQPSSCGTSCRHGFFHRHHFRLSRPSDSPSQRHSALSELGWDEDPSAQLLWEADGAVWCGIPSFCSHSTMKSLWALSHSINLNQFIHRFKAKNHCLWSLK